LKYTPTKINQYWLITPFGPIIQVNKNKPDVNKLSLPAPFPNGIDLTVAGATSSRLRTGCRIELIEHDQQGAWHGQCCRVIQTADQKFNSL